MTRKRKSLLVVLVAVLALAWLVWFYAPVKMLSVSPEQVSYIHDFYRTNGVQVYITDRAQIEHIVENLSGLVFKRDELVTGFGLAHDLTFYDENNKAISNFVVQSSNQVKKGRYFFIDKTNSIDMAYLDWIIEEEIRKNWS